MRAVDCEAVLIAVVKPEVIWMWALLRNQRHFGLSWRVVVPICRVVEKLNIDVEETK